MKNNEITKQLIGCHKVAFETGYDSALMLQEHTSKAVDNFLKKAPWVPIQAKSIINEWNGVYKNGAETFKEIADQGYSKLEDVLTTGFEAFKSKYDGIADEQKSISRQVLVMKEKRSRKKINNIKKH